MAGERGALNAMYLLLEILWQNFGLAASFLEAVEICCRCQPRRRRGCVDLATTVISS